MGKCPGKDHAFFAGVQRPPLRDLVNPSSRALPGKTRRGAQRRRFSRRGALCAPASHGLMYAKAGLAGPGDQVLPGGRARDKVA